MEKQKATGCLVFQWCRGKKYHLSVNMEEENAIYPRIIAKKEIRDIVPQYFLEGNDYFYTLNPFLFLGLFDVNIYKPYLIKMLQNSRKDNKIKQKSLSLGEDLINFLNDNNIRNCFVEPLVGFINNEVVVINMPLTDEDLFIEELLNKIQTSTIKLDSETIDKCAVLINNYSADCSSEI